MSAWKETESRYTAVERALYELGWENVEWLEEWDGEDVESLREVLSEEQYQALADQLQEQDART